jgi:hypothetical protein
MKFITCWALMIVLWAVIAAAMGVKAIIGFALGVIVVMASSLAVGLAAASFYDREGDSWEP